MTKNPHDKYPADKIPTDKIPDDNIPGDKNPKLRNSDKKPTFLFINFLNYQNKLFNTIQWYRKSGNTVRDDKTATHWKLQCGWRICTNWKNKCVVWIYCPRRVLAPEGQYRSPRVYKSLVIRYRYKLVCIYQKKSRFVQFKPAMRFWVIAANDIGNEIVRSLQFW